MKEKYEAPIAEVTRNDADIITTSDGVNTPIIGENDGVWDLNVG